MESTSESTSRCKPLSLSASLALHGVAIVLLFFLTTRVVDPPVPHPSPTTLYLPPRDTNVYVPDSNSGGGQNMNTPATRGAILKMTAIPLSPPLVDLADNPKLEVEPAIAGLDIELPKSTLPWGDPNSILNGPASGGPGKRGGYGDGGDGGIGNGSKGAGFQNLVFRPGGNGGVSLPELIYRVEPEFTDAARKAKYQGTVEMTVVVDSDGQVRDPRVTKSVGLGLDEKAIEAVMKWKFKPGKKDGRAVPVYAQILVTFRLL